MAEVAGLVLGAFPLLISAAESYKKGFEPLLKWKRFRTEFIGFIDAVDIQKQLFDQMMERFLISADVPQDQIKSFMTVKNYEGWRRPDLINKLKSRLGPSYPAFFDWADEGASNWDYQLKRIRLSFSKRGTETVALLEMHNRKLRELLDSSDKLESMKAATTRKDTTWANVFDCIRKHAGSLHSAIKNGWQCSCESPHLAALRLQKHSTTDWTSQFNMSFTVPPKIAAPQSRREVVIGIKEITTPINPPDQSIKNPIPHEEVYLDKLRRDFEPKTTSQTSSLSRPILPPSVSSLSSTSSASSSLFGSFFTKSESSLNTSISMNGTESLLDTGSSRSLFSGRKTKAKKRVRMTLPGELAISSSTPSTPKSPPTPSQAPYEVPSIEIKDLCSTLFDKNIDATCLGYLTDDQKRQHELRPIKDAPPFSADDTLISLDIILSNKADIRLNRQERYKVASVLATSLLQLQTTPWLADKMEKKNIFFYRRGSKVLIEHPYISHAFKSNKTKPLPRPINTTSPTPATRFAARNSLSHLGILLLELCFGQAIENQDFRKSYLGPDGKANEVTDYMTARDWTEMVCDEEPMLEPIIRCCVFCIFEEKANWENKKFVQAVYASVVDPLERIIEKWSLE
ncbi:hypothetical protein B7494_g5026 [Chlorociboria aeruginascens]|nr:hypothetical protein B7494_g5026 [Chlorociboria aeruginascens]